MWRGDLTGWGYEFYNCDYNLTLSDGWLHGNAGNLFRRFLDSRWGDSSISEVVLEGKKEPHQFTGWSPHD